MHLSRGNFYIGQGSINGHRMGVEKRRHTGGGMW